MARWVMNFDDSKAGGSKALALSRTKGVLNDGATIPYAFGIVHGEYRGRPTVSHGGSWAGFSTAVLHFPAQHFGVVVLANSPIVPSSRFANVIADIFLDSELGPRPAPVVDPVASAPSVTVKAVVLDRYPGLYRFGPGLYLRVGRDGDGLKAKATPGTESALTAKSDTSFWAQGFSTPLVFLANGELVFRTLRSPKLAESKRRRATASSAIP